MSWKFKFALLASVAMVGLEIWLLLEAGGWMGIPLTLGWVIFTGLGALLLLRVHGWRVLLRIRNRLALHELPTLEMLNMGLVLVGAVCLLLPGFISDAVGLMMISPPTNWILLRLARYFLGGILPPAGSAPRGYGLPD